MYARAHLHAGPVVSKCTKARVPTRVRAYKKEVCYEQFTCRKTISNLHGLTEP